MSYAGYRSSGDSWWTENYLGEREDPAGLDDASNGSDSVWPWLVVAASVPTADVAAEAAGLAATEALLGALVLLDHPPGVCWGGSLPWIPGQLCNVEDPRLAVVASRDNVLPTAPQRVDARALALDNAESFFGEPFPRDLDIAAHTKAPGSVLLTSTLDDATSEAPTGLALACRLAWHASASLSSDIRSIATAHAIRMFLALVSYPESEAYQTLASGGLQWRLAGRELWPSSWPWSAEDDPETSVGSVEAISRLELPAWHQVTAQIDQSPALPPEQLMRRSSHRRSAAASLLLALGRCHRR